MICTDSRRMSRWSAVVALGATLVWPAAAQAASNPNTIEEAQALDEATEYCSTNQELLDLVPDIALQEHPELYDLILNDGGAGGDPAGGGGYEAQPAISDTVTTNAVQTGDFIPGCPAAGLGLLGGFPPPYGFYPITPVNNWCLPNSPDNGCTVVPDTGLTFDFRAACRQHDLAYRWTPADRFSVDNQLLRDMLADCARRNLVSRAACSARAAIRYAAVRLFSGFAFGNSEWPGYNRPGSPTPLPATTTCAQPTHARLETFGQGNRLRRGVNVFLTGVVRKHSRVRFEFRDSGNNLVAEHLTYFAEDNCVVRHEPEAFNTANLPVGTIGVTAAYVAWEDNQVRTTPVATLDIFNGTGTTTCNQPSHAWVATFGQGNRLQQGAIVYLTGVVRRHTQILFQFRDGSGNVVANHWTHPARDNCVVHHEPEAFNTGVLPVGAINVTATYTEWETDQTVTVSVANLEIVAPPPPPTCFPQQEQSCWENGGTWDSNACQCRFDPCPLTSSEGGKDVSPSMPNCY